MFVFCPRYSTLTVGLERGVKWSLTLLSISSSVNLLNMTPIGVPGVAKSKKEH